MENSERNVSPMLYELEPNQVVDISDQAFEDLRVSLEKIEAMKQTVAESIIKAKQKNLQDHVEKFRALLRKLVIMENSLKEEQTKKETAKLAAELDQLEDEVGKEIKADESALASPETESRHLLTSVRYGIAAKLLGFGGVFACLLGCILYLIFVQIDAMDVYFEWIWLVINGLGVVLFTVIGLALNSKSLYYAGLAQKDADDRVLEEEKKAQKLAAEFSNIAAAAYALELEKENADKKAEPEEDGEETSGGKFFSLKKVKKGKTEGVHVTVKGNPVLILTAIATGVAAVATALLVGKRSKGKKEKKAAEKAPKIQGIFFQVDN